jgi:pimeloyl-ACP methyl ester carboxylesterase
MHAPHDTLLVMLPPAKARGQDLVDHGFVSAVRDRGLPVDVRVMDVQPDYYLDRDVGERLAADILDPARGYLRVWLMGISLGGYGCIELARQRAQELAGLILLAPFLGSRGPEALEDADEQWFGTAYLGFGERDRYAAASQMLALRLMPDRVVKLPGEHDWPTWLRLWHTLLDKPVL